ncbi:uncharacterized protein LOC111110908 [Crassostrea virginica]
MEVAPGISENIMREGTCRRTAFKARSLGDYTARAPKNEENSIFNSWHGEGMQPSVTNRECFYKSKCFEHFHYILELIRDCASRVRLITPNLVEETQLHSNCMVKITYTGDVTDDNIKLVTARKEKKKTVKDEFIWKVSPIICFQSESSPESEFLFDGHKEVNHKIFVKSNKARKDDLSIDNVVIVKRDHVQEALTSCLEKPLHVLLDKWSKGIKRTQATTKTHHLISEIESIRKQMLFEDTKEAFESDDPRPTSTNIVPGTIKEYLFRKADVTSFGLWQDFVFKVFVKKGTDKDELHDEIKTIDKTFFETYELQIENYKIEGELAMMQGDLLLPNPSVNGEHVFGGTLGGFVTKPNDIESKYALTCAHLFQNESQAAYVSATPQPQQIGKCLFKIEERDFAAIEIDETVSKDCDIIFRRDDKKKTNAHVYDGDNAKLGVLHKRGAKTGLTKGYICSEEFYVKHLTDENNRESLFFVRGTGTHFSDKGDSGSLVFSRPREVKQNYVNVVGMVFGSGVIVQDDDEISKEPKCEKDKLTVSEESNPDSLPSSFIVNENISTCYRIQPALDILKKEKRVPVKFKDDLSSSSSSSSSSDDDL